MPTLNLQIDYLQAAQQQKEVTANEAIDELDAAIGGTLSKTITTADVTLTGPPTQNSEAMKFRHVRTGALPSPPGPQAFTKISILFHATPRYSSVNMARSRIKVMWDQINNIYDKTYNTG